MKYRNEMLAESFLMNCRLIVQQYMKTYLDIHNHTYNSNLNCNHINFTKAIMHYSNQSISIYYCIKETYPHKNFINLYKNIIIKILKSRIKMKKFPFVKFIYDNNYENIFDILIKKYQKE